MSNNCFYTKIVGVTYTNSDGISRQSLLGECTSGSRILLVRDKRNNYDINCINVCNSNGDVLGHLSKEIAARLAPEMDKGKKYTVKIANLTGGGKYNIGCNINIFEGSSDSCVNIKTYGHSSPPKSAKPNSSTSVSGLKSARIYTQHTKKSEPPDIMNKVYDTLISGLAIFNGKIAEWNSEKLRKAEQQKNYELIYDSNKSLLGRILLLYIKIVHAHVTVSFLLCLSFAVYIFLAILGLFLWMFDYNAIFPMLTRLNNIINYVFTDIIIPNMGYIVIVYMANVVVYLLIYFRERKKFYANVPKECRREVIFHIGGK